MSNPRIKFRISKTKDFEVLESFLQDSARLSRYLKWALAPHRELLNELQLKNSFRRSWPQIERYADGFYRENRKTMIRQYQKLTKDWKKKEKKFYSLVMELFKDVKWSKGRYIAYLTIWGIYPRFLEDKTFMVPYKHRIPNYAQVVIAHEMLHFKFYDFFAKHYPRYKNPNDNPFVWHISEIFNAVIQSTPQWVRVFGAKPMYYPEHKVIIQKLSHWWTRQPRNTDAKVLIDKIIQAAKHQKQFREA